MNKLNCLKVALGPRTFLIAAVFSFSFLVLAGNLTAVNGQGFTLKLIQVRVFNGLDGNGVIASERYNENGGSVEINVQGNAKYVCPGGAEKMRFVWTFGRNASQIVPATGVSATVEAGQVNASPPCSTGLSGNSEFTLQGSSEMDSPFSHAESGKIDSAVFFQPPEERNRVFPYTSDGTRRSAVIGVRVRDRADRESQFAWFKFVIGTNAGRVQYVYLYEIVRAGVTHGNIAGSWESSFSGSWKPTSIRQDGNRIWFTNEFGDTSEGTYESTGRVKATKWNVGATIQDSNTIKWDNGTVWRKGGGGSSSSVSIEYDTDRPGGDYVNYDLPQPDVELCRSACAKDSRCNAFTYVKPAVQGASARCWLKSSIPAGGPSGCCISGTKTHAQISKYFDRGRNEYDSVMNVSFWNTDFETDPLEITSDHWPHSN